jgi:hypothetical protein
MIDKDNLYVVIAVDYTYIALPYTYDLIPLLSNIATVNRDYAEHCFIAVNKPVTISIVKGSDIRAESDNQLSADITSLKEKLEELQSKLKVSI